MPRATIAALTAAALLNGCATAAYSDTSNASKNAAEKSGEQMTDKSGPHIIRTKSMNDFDTTVTKLQSAIDSRGLKTFAVIDHAKGAASVDQDLRPTTLIIFGNPKAGTPLLQSEQTMGIELPLRALVYQTEDGAVMIATTDIAHSLHKFGVTDKDVLGGKIGGTLQMIAEEAGN